MSYLKGHRNVTGTHFFSSIFARTNRVKFFSSMKAIKKAMNPPTQEAMIMVSVLSTTFTERGVARE